MAGRAEAVDSGRDLEDKVHLLASRLGLEVASQVRVGRRIWGAERHIDVLLRDPKTGRRLGIECKFQGTPGTAEEKILAVLKDIEAWPIDGLVVISGAGFSNHMTAFLLSTGKVVDLEDLEVWMRLFFGLPLE
jgi:hypothetical protein